MSPTRNRPQKHVWRGFLKRFLRGGPVVLGLDDVKHFQCRLDGGLRLVGIQPSGAEHAPAELPRDDRLHEGVGTSAGRDAHGIVGQLVLMCIERGIPLDDLPLEDYRQLSPAFDEDIYSVVSLDACVNKRLTIGAPGRQAMQQAIDKDAEYLTNY